MGAEQTRGRSGGRARRFVVRALLVLGVVLAAAWFARAPLVGFALERAARGAGIELAWTRLELEGLHRLEITSLAATRAGDVDLAADRVVLLFDAWRLLRAGLGGVEQVEIDGARGTLGPPRPAPRADPRPLRLPDHLPRIEARTRDLSWRVDAMRRFDVHEGAVTFDGRGVRLAAASFAWTEGPRTIAHPLDVRAELREGRLVVERAVWDARFVLEDARFDVSDAAQGRVGFDALARGFEGHARLVGRLEDGVLRFGGRVQDLDLGAATRAFGSPRGPRIEGRVRGTANVAIPLAAPRDLEASFEFRARDVAFVRAFDEVSGRVELFPGGIRFEDVLVLHGANAALVRGSLPALGTDPCTWIDALRVSCDADLGDPRAVLADDIGLRLGSGEPWTEEPLRISAQVHAGDVIGHAACARVDAGAIVRAFARDSTLQGEVDLDVDVHVPLSSPAWPTVAGLCVGADTRFQEHHVDTWTARARYAPEGLTVAGAEAHDGRNQARVEWAHLPRELLLGCPPAEVPAFVVRGLWAEFDDLPRLLHGPIVAPALDRFHAHRLAFAGHVASGEIVLARGSIETEAGAARLGRGRVPIPATVADLWSDPRLDLELELEFADVRPAALAWWSEDFAEDLLPRGAVSGRAHVSGGPRGPSGELALGARDLVVRGVTFEEADVRARLDEHRLRIEEARAQCSLGSLTLAGTYTFADRRIDEGLLDLDVVDLARLAPQTLPAGRVQIHAVADGPLPSLRGRAFVSGQELSFGNLRLDELELTADAADGAWKVDCTRLRGHGVEAAFVARARDFDWTLKSGAIDVESLSFAWNDVRAALSEPTRVSFGEDGFSLSGLRLASEGGRLHADFTRSAEETRVSIALAAPLPREVLALAGLETSAADLDAACVALVRGRDVEGHTSGVLTLHGATGASDTRLDWSADLAGERLTLERLTLEQTSGEERARVDLTGSFPLALQGDERLPDGPLEVHLDGRVPDLGRLPAVDPDWRLTGGATLTCDLAGSWREPRGRVSTTLSAAAAPGVAGLSEIGSVAGSAQFALADSTRLDAAEFVVDELLFVRAAGSLAAPLDLREILHGRLDRLLDAPLDFAVRAEADDLAPLAPRLPTLRRVSGRVQADLHVVGTLAGPSATGTGALTAGEIRTTTNLPAIVGVSSRVSFDGRDLVVEALEGEMGGAPFALRGRLGLLDPAHEVELALSGASLLVWRDRDVTVRADADLVLSGPLDALVLSGDLALRDGRFTRKLDFLALGRRGPRSAGTRGLRLFELAEAPFSTMRFDVDVTSATPFTIASNVLKGRVVPTLRLVGTGALPELRGSILVEPSRVLLPSGALRVRAGRIEFRADRPDVPDLDIQASARLQGYDVEVNVSGSYDDPKVELSSVPPLPREDLAVLLVTGRPPTGGLAGALGQRAALDIAVYIARDVAAAWFEADEEDVESLAERLEVVVGADRTKSGADAVLVRMRIAGDIQTKGRAVYVTGERDVYDFYNFGLRFVFTFQ